MVQTHSPHMNTTVLNVKGVEKNMNSTAVVILNTTAVVVLNTSAVVNKVHLKTHILSKGDCG